MRILFMGTPDFAVPSLMRLVGDGHDICGVFTQPDKPRGRGMKISYSPVKIAAVRENIPVFQPVSLKDEAVRRLIEGLAPELVAVVAYGKLLPDYVLSYPKFGCVNVHASILPKYRGAAPIHWAVINGERETGVTTMHMASRLDAGDIIYVDKTEISPCDTVGSVHDRLMLMGAELLSKTVDAAANGTLPRIPQNDGDATFAPMITKETCRIDWTQSVARILNLIRGTNPWPTAWTKLDGVIIKIHSASLGEKVDGYARGAIIPDNSSGAVCAVCSGGEVIRITELQAQGGKRMSASDYLRGHGITDGKAFE